MLKLVCWEALSHNRDKGLHLLWTQGIVIEGNEQKASVGRESGWKFGRVALAEFLSELHV
jgi:hypothetical protein